MLYSEDIQSTQDKETKQIVGADTRKDRAIPAKDKFPPAKDRVTPVREPKEAERIQKTLTKGSAKQRILLIITDMAEKNLGGKGFLLNTEVNELILGFTTAREKAVFKKFMKIDLHIKNALGLLYQYKNAYREQIASINGYTLLFESYSFIWAMIEELRSKVDNNTLSNEIIKDVVDINFLINIDKKTGLPNKTEVITLIELHRQKAEQFLIEFKTLLRAMRDVVKEEGFNVKPHIKQYNSAEKEVIDLITPTAKQRNREEYIRFPFPDYKTILTNENRYKYFRRLLG